MWKLLLLGYVSVAHSLTCGQVKDFYQDSSCCETEDSSDVLSTCTTPTPFFGFPKCFSTFKDLSLQYTTNSQWNYITSTDGFVYRPYLGSSPFDCASIPSQLALMVPHASPLGLTVLDISSSASGFPATYHQLLLVSLTGSWNRDPGTESGGKWDMMTMVAESGSVRAGKISAFFEPDPSAPRPLQDPTNPFSSYLHTIRPSEIQQSPKGHIFAAAKNGGVIEGVFAVRYDTNESVASSSIANYMSNALITSMNVYNDPVSMWRIDSDPCARRMAFTEKYMIVSYNNHFCLNKMKDENGTVINDGVYSALKAYKLDETGSYSSSAYIVRGLHVLDGVAVVGGTLFMATSDSCTGNLGARTMKIENADAHIDAIFAGTRSFFGVSDFDGSVSGVSVIGHHPLVKSWHNLANIDATPDGKYILHQLGSDCNRGCMGYIYAMKISDGSVYEFASGVRNPTGFHTYGDYILVSDMGSDMGNSMPPEYSEGALGGMNGPNDRIIAIKYTEPSVPFVISVEDDVGKKVKQSGTTCAALISSIGCDGLWTWPEISFFGDAAKLYVKDECQKSCNSSFALRSKTDEACLY